MKTLTLRIYLTVVAVMLAFALLSAGVYRAYLDAEQNRIHEQMAARMEAFADLMQLALPDADSPDEAQEQHILNWSERLLLPMALDDAKGRRIATSSIYQHRAVRFPDEIFKVPLSDGRVLWLMAPVLRNEFNAAVRWQDGGRPSPPVDAFWVPQARWLSLLPPQLISGGGIVLLLLMLFVAVAAGAWPVARALTKRVEVLKEGMITFGEGDLSHRVKVEGKDEVASVAASFNAAADRVQALLHAHKILLANASHELRSPLARLRLAVDMLPASPAPEQARAMQEILTNVGELDALVEEVLLSSRLDANPDVAKLTDQVDLHELALEEAARAGAVVLPVSPLRADADVLGDERLLRRAVRNLLENAKRYGGGAGIEVHIKVHSGEAEGAAAALSAGGAASVISLAVCDRGPGVPENLRAHIFEAFYRLPGHAEQAGGVGLGLALVKQIAERHDGHVRCLGREGGGAVFEITLPTFASRLAHPDEDGLEA